MVFGVEEDADGNKSMKRAFETDTIRKYLLYYPVEFPMDSDLPLLRIRLDYLSFNLLPKCGRFAEKVVRFHRPTKLVHL